MQTQAGARVAMLTCMCTILRSSLSLNSTNSLEYASAPCDSWPEVTHCLVCVSAAADALDELNTLDEDADVDGVDCFIAASNT